LVTDFLKSVLMYSKGAICLSKLLFKMGLFTVQKHKRQRTVEQQGTIGQQQGCQNRWKHQ
jgi:hypothetical protein